MFTLSVIRHGSSEKDWGGAIIVLQHNIYNIRRVMIRGIIKTS